MNDEWWMMVLHSQGMLHRSRRRGATNETTTWNWYLNVLDKTTFLIGLWAGLYSTQAVARWQWVSWGYTAIILYAWTGLPLFLCRYRYDNWLKHRHGTRVCGAANVSLLFEKQEAWPNDIISIYKWIINYVTQWLRFHRSAIRSFQDCFQDSFHRFAAPNATKSLQDLKKWGSSQASLVAADTVWGHPLSLSSNLVHLNVHLNVHYSSLLVTYHIIFFDAFQFARSSRLSLHCRKLTSSRSKSSRHWSVEDTVERCWTMLKATRMFGRNVPQWKCRRDTLGGALHRDAVVRGDTDIYLFYHTLQAELSSQFMCFTQ